MTISSTLGDPARVVAIAEAHEGVWAALGVHPHEASGWTDEREADLRRHAMSARVLAIGEIGLDYHYDHSPRDVQRDVFRRQLRLARELDLPVVIHTRDAEDDTAALLADEAGPRGGVLHCFTSKAELARRAVELGLLVSFSGIVTFARTDELREVARAVPGDRLLVETDAPFLAPVPHRGQTNEPAFVRITAQRLADLRGVTLEALAQETSANFDRVFRPGARA